MRKIQIVLRKLHQWFFCWHEWKRLRQIGLPNEPDLSQCQKCDQMAKTIY